MAEYFEDGVALRRLQQGVDISVPTFAGKTSNAPATLTLAQKLAAKASAFNDEGFKKAKAHFEVMMDKHASAGKNGCYLIMASDEFHLKDKLMEWLKIEGCNPVWISDQREGTSIKVTW